MLLGANYKYADRFTTHTTWLQYALCECRSFVREIYDGQLSIKLKKGVNLPAMDPWVGYPSQPLLP